MTHKRISIERDINGVEGLYMATHNNDSLGYYLGKPIADIHTIRAAVGALPELVNRKGQLPMNKRTYIQLELRKRGLIAKPQKV